MAMVKGIPGVNQYCRAFVVFTRDLRCTTGSLRLKSFCDTIFEITSAMLRYNCWFAASCYASITFLYKIERLGKETQLL